MRYIYGAAIFIMIMGFAVRDSMACEMRTTIRSEIRDRLANIEIDIDAKDLENRIHDMVHSRLDREKDRLDHERDRLRDERRQLDHERSRLRNERSRASRDNDDDDTGWGKSALLAFGLYGVGLFMLTRRSRRQRNTE